MFGHNYIAKKDHGDGSTLKVVAGSPFLTIQGEGPYSGWPAIFVRLHGCHLACTFCDTQFSDPGDPTLTVEQIMDAIHKETAKAGRAWHRLVVITGGEPMRQNIVPLCQRLHEEGYLVQIETAGDFWLNGIHLYAGIIVSPKTSHLAKSLRVNALAFKYVINAETQFTDDGIPIANTQGRDPVELARPDPSVPIYLSPMNEYNDFKNKANIAAVRDACRKYGYIAGLQMHTIFGVD